VVGAGFTLRASTGRRLAFTGAGPGIRVGYGNFRAVVEAPAPAAVWLLAAGVAALATRRALGCRRSAA